MTFAAWRRRHPLSGDLALAHGIGWGGIIVGGTGLNLAELRPLATGLIFISMLLGPSAAGLALTALREGREGMSRLGSRAGASEVGPALVRGRADDPAIAVAGRSVAFERVVGPGLRATIAVAAVRDRARRQLRGRRVLWCLESKLRSDTP